MNTQSGRQTEPSYELIKEQSPNSVLYRQHGFPNPLVRWHYHKEYELHLITESSGKVFIGDYIGNFYPGNLILTGPNLPHNWVTLPVGDETYPNRDKVLNFTEEWIQETKSVLPEISTLEELLKRARFGIQFHGKSTIRLAYKYFNEISETSGLKRLSTFLRLMCELADTQEFQLLSSEKFLTVRGEKNQQRVNQALNYILASYNLDISLEEVADHLGMKPTYFSKFFRQATGRRFVEFVNSLRITRACDLLAHSELPITDICFDVGFTNISNFNRRFHALKGMTPSEYRKLSIVAVSQNESI
ncbi:AraC family transcriptional regulator [Hahella sp. CCB-MM4]|uniref:AraC family transcriptional regulator n=1 Tax=Hahella sp. (strain CCB-MM4) TaxID=1926491 RepID=UPI000B9A95E1|nr:AraC family transcriptional regulator [Hahella sp. CCB-MM4]OZG70467.1 AraC family transcriptional regulator [Hahella sp. CCB-MM4]